LPTTAEIFAIGDELCYGRVYDTNSFWLADQVTRRGVLVKRITCLRDSKTEICEALRNSLDRSPNYLLITGGLGPTQDDLTLSALSELSGKAILVSELILKIMSERRKIPFDSFNPGQIKMANTLEDAECLPNPIGWAPVTILKLGESQIISMPGPPREAQGCFNEHLAKRIEDTTGFRSYGRRVRVTMFESELAPLVLEVNKTVEGVYVKPLVGDSTRDQGLPVEILAFGQSDEACHQKCDLAVGKLKELVTQKGRELLDT
jgi:nicotinamide-nucleotide amidase